MPLGELPCVDGIGSGGDGEVRIQELDHTSGISGCIDWCDWPARDVGIWSDGASVVSQDKASGCLSDAQSLGAVAFAVKQFVLELEGFGAIAINVGASLKFELRDLLICENRLSCLAAVFGEGNLADCAGVVVPQDQLKAIGVGDGVGEVAVGIDSESNNDGLVVIDGKGVAVCCCEQRVGESAVRTSGEIRTCGEVGVVS